MEYISICSLLQYINKQPPLLLDNNSHIENQNHFVILSKGGFGMGHLIYDLPLQDSKIKINKPTLYLRLIIYKIETKFCIIVLLT